MTPTTELLLNLIKDILSSQPMSKSGYEASVDTQKALYEECVNHHIEPFVYPMYKERVKPVSDAVLPYWQQTYFIANLNHKKESLQIAKVLETLLSHQIPVAAFKGLYTSTLSRPACIRQLSDYDLFVPLDYQEEVRVLLEAMGYHYNQEAMDAIHHVYNHRLYKPIEVHHAVVSQNLPKSYRVFNAYFASHFTQVSLLGNLIYVPDATTHALYTCMHMLGHLCTSSFGIRGLIDLVLLTQLDDFSWDDFMTLTQTFHLDHFNHALIKLCHDHLNLQVPDLVAKRLETLNLRYYHMLQKEIWDNGEFGTKSQVLKSNSGFASLVTPAKSKQSHSIKQLFPRYNYMASRYPFIKKWPPLLPLAWSIRIGSVLLSFRYRRVRDRSKLLSYMIQ